MGLKFRRGTNAQKSGSLAFGEPYVNTDLNTLMVGGLAGDITLATSVAAGAYATTGSNTFIGDQSITGSLGITGDLALGGNITIGNATSDTLSVTANLSSSLVPESTNAFDIGSSTKTYRTIYGGIISGSTLQIMSSGNPELRLINKMSGVAYHIQNGAAGALHIHNATTDTLLLRFTSASLQDDHSAEFFGSLSVSKSISSPTITGINTFTGSANTRLTNLENKTSSLATTGSNTFLGNQTIIGSGAGFAAYISTSVNDATLGLDTTANVNALYFLKNQEKNFEVSYDTTNANGIFRLLPYDNNSFFQIGNPSNSGANYVFISEPTYGNVLIGPGIGNGVSSLVGSTPATDKVQVTGNLYVSGAINANSFTGSIASTNGVISGSSQLTSSFARLNTANVFTGNQTITGSLYITQDLVVQGSSSIQNITSSNLAIGAAFVTLNALTPSSNFAGIKVVDSGSTFTTASFIYDGLNNNWVFEKANVGSSDTSVAIFGPISTNGLGTELGLTQNKLPKAVSSHGHHIGDSNISDDGTTIVLGSNTEVTGSLTVTGGIIGSIAATNGVISGSSQLATDFEGRANSSKTIISGSSQLATDFEGRANSSKTIISGSSQLATDFEGRANSSKTIISGSSQLATDFEGRANSSKTIISGSSQLETVFEGRANSSKTIISGSSQLETVFEGRANSSKTIFSGSSQVSLGSASGNITLATQTTGDYVASLVAGTNITLSNNSGEGATPTIGLTNNAITIAGTSTSLGGTITAEQIRTAIGTVVTGSSQISFGGVTGLVSNSQLSNSSITIAGTSTALGGTITAATILQGTGVVSGSSQVQLGSASGNIALATQTTGDYVASLVAGTGITLSNNSGENATPTIAIGQSVATNATPTFGNLTINGSINATGDITAYYTSDKRHKNNIQPIENALLKVSKLNGVTWEWNDDVHEVTKSTPKTGLIAQEVQEVLPEVIKEREDGFLALDYSKMMGLMVEAIKEQQTQIHNLTLEIENLKKVKGL
jgi:hypothetical protein